MPLFDRLVASGDAHLLGADALRESIARDLGRLLNTRSQLTHEDFHAQDGTTIDYGMPDCSERSLRSGDDREVIAAAIRRAIVLFEPRLANVTVDFPAAGANGREPRVRIAGDMRSGESVSHVAFELASGGRAHADPRWTDHG
ncbi:MAG TPA: type VI secretion system baseplate subunit TssE [Paraburkholderia sp.]